MNIEVLDKLEDIQALSESWGELHRRCKGRLYTHPAWIYNNYRCFDSIARVLITVRENGQLTGVFPFSVVRLKIKSLNYRALSYGCTAGTDYSMFLVDPASNLSRMIRRVLDTLDNLQPSGWDIYKIDNLNDSDAIASLFRALFLERNYGGCLLTDSTPVVELDRPFANSKVISGIRRREHQMYDCEVMEYSGEQIDDDVFSRFVSLHRLEFADSYFDKKKERDFYTSLVEHPEFRSRVKISFLQTSGNLIAAHMGFVEGGRYYYYAPCYDPAYRALGPGKMLMWKLISAAQKDRVEVFDFLRGNYAYKYEWANRVNHNFTLIGAPRKARRRTKLLISMWLLKQDYGYMRLAGSKPAARSVTYRKQSGSEIDVIVLATGLNGLGAIRSLHKQGMNVAGVFRSKRDLGAMSRLICHKYYLSNDASDDELLNLLMGMELIRKIPVITCSDNAATFIQKNQAELSSKYTLLCPPENVVEVLNDKQQEIELMWSISVDLPDSFIRLGDIVDAGEHLSLPYPLILKPRTQSDFARFANKKNFIVDTPDELEMILDQYSDAGSRMIAQKVISGDDTNLWVCNATFDRNSDLACAFTFRRLGTSPSHYGVTSMAISEDNQIIKELVRKIGKSLSYIGPAMIEFKYDEQSDRYLYIETNPRLGMCNWYDTGCGVNNVHATYQVSMGLKVSQGQQQRDGIVFVNLLGDFIARLENKESVSRILSIYLKYLGRRKVWSMMKSDDPLPCLYNGSVLLLEVARRMMKKLLRVMRVKT